MSTTDKYLTYRGDLKAAAGAGGTVLFVTAHPEGQPTAVYRLDADKLSLAEDPLPAGGAALVVDESGAAWAAGTDRNVYRVAAGKTSRVGVTLESEPSAIALLADERIAVLADTRVAVLSRNDGSPTQAPLF